VKLGVQDGLLRGDLRNKTICEKLGKRRKNVKFFGALSPTSGQPLGRGRQEGRLLELQDT